jgi:phospholipid/cholesterol/gamma-HCH transport system substrate-binding protein
MKRSGDIKWGELRLGLLIFVGLALLLWASIQGGTSLFQKQYELNARFPNVQGVVAGAPVWFQGVEVGTVKELQFVPSGDTAVVNIQFTVNDRVWPLVREDSRVRIQALNLFGEKMMEVTPGSAGSPPAKDGATLPSVRPTDMAEIVAGGQVIVEDLKLMTADLKSLMARVNRGEGSLGRMLHSEDLYTNLDLTVRQVRTLTASLDRSQIEMTRSLRAVTASLDSTLALVRTGDGSLGRMARDPELYDNLTSATGRLDSTLARIERGEGSLGRLATDDAAAKNLEQSLERLSNLLADLQANPKKYFKFSVF